MVEKISVNVAIPALNIEHNFLVPEDMSAENAVCLMVQALSEEYGGIGIGCSRGYMLMKRSSGKVLNSACSLKQLGIVRGDNLLLI